MNSGKVERIADNDIEKSSQSSVTSCDMNANQCFNVIRY